MKKKDIPFSVDSSGIEQEILGFACSTIRARRTDGKPDKIPAGWIEKALLLYGRIGWVPSETDAEGFYKVHRIGITDRYGMPEMAILTTDATASPQFSASVIGSSAKDHTPLQVAIVRANALSRPPILSIRRYANVIAACDIALPANVIASMRSQIVGIPETLKDSVEELLIRSARGLPVICTTDLLESIKTADVSVDFRGQDYQNLRTTLWSEAIKQFGGITPAQYKAERTQSAEVSANIAASIDNVYMLIDQFNEDAERYSVPYRLEYVGFGARYDESEQDPAPEENPEDPAEEDENEEEES